MRKYVGFLGGGIFLLSLYLAFVLKYNHFYEFLLVGLFFILYSLVSKKSLDNKLYLLLYLIFILGGLIADLLLGLTLTDLWYYTYTGVVEYVLLYLLVYPFGGLVMIQSYLFFKERLERKSKKRKYSISVLKDLGWFSLMVFLVSLVMKYVLKVPHFEKLIFISLTFGFFFYWNYKSEQYGQLSYMGDWFNNFKLFLFINLISTYLNAFIHEWPNTFAQQWVYSNWFLTQLTWLNIPVVVFFVGWLALTFIPVSLYYYLLALRKKGFFRKKLSFFN